MRRRAVAASIVSSSAVILVGWQIGTHAQATESSSSIALPAPANAGSATATPTPTTSAGASTTPSTTPAAPSASAAGSSSPAPSAAQTSNTFTGSVVSTRYGNVQVQITVSGGTITDVTPLQLTDDGGRSVQISNQAAPILRTEVLAAQSASVDSVSGATYTTDGYLKSLQSALDQAGL